MAAEELTEALHIGEHKHYCPACSESWWCCATHPHESVLVEGANKLLDPRWTLTCPLHDGPDGTSAG